MALWAVAIPPAGGEQPRGAKSADTIREDKHMIHGSRHSSINVRASRRAGSKVRYHWLLVPLLPGFILMASPAALAKVAARNAQGFRHCEGFNELTLDDPEFRRIAAIPKAKRTNAEKDYVICLVGYHKRDPKDE
jgi:hypothetical protein